MCAAPYRLQPDSQTNRSMTVCWQDLTVFGRMTNPCLPTRALRDEVWPTLRLALPLVLTEIGWMSMGAVPIMFALISANIVNFFGDWGLLTGILDLGRWASPVPVGPHVLHGFTWPC